jgi:hypothetical protein
MTDPLSVTWLRDADDRLFHAVPLDQLPPPTEPPGPIALCGKLVLLVSLFDEPEGPRCRPCLSDVRMR